MAEETKSENQNQNQIVVLDKQIAEAKSVRELLELPGIIQRSVDGYKSITGKADGVEKYRQERFAYIEILQQKPDLRAAPNFVHFKVLNKVMHSGLSLRDNKLYLQAIKKGDAVVDIKVDPSPAGRRDMLELMKTVKRAPEAQIVLKGDIFLHDRLNQRIIKHETTEKSATEISLDNILFSYQRIIWADNTITDVVVPHDDLVQAKKKSKIKSTDAGLWVEFPGEACKKTATNRAFRLYHKYNENAMVLDEDKDEDTKDTAHVEVTELNENQDQYIQSQSGEQVDTDTGEVTQKAEEPKVIENDKKSKKQYDLLS